jgi:hypothetical protein
MRKLEEILTKKDVWTWLETIGNRLTATQKQEFVEWWAGTEQVVDYQPLKPEFRTENMLKELQKKLLDEVKT